MPRPPRIHLHDAAYFVTLEGAKSEPIFKDDQDYQEYLQLLSRIQREFSFKLFSYVLLPDHIYLLVEPTEEFSISHIMQKITPLYTKHFNARYQRKGPLFPKRFRSVIVERENHLTSMTRYTHLIPTRRGLVQRPEQYPYSSLSGYLCSNPELQNDALGVKEKTEVLEQLNGQTYEHYLTLAHPSEMEFLDKKLSHGSVLGSDAFERRVKERMKESSELHPVGEREQKVEWREPMGAGSISSPRTFGWPLALVLTMAVSGYSVYLNHHFASNLLPTHPAPVVQNVLRQPDLNGTVWEIEMTTVSADGKERPIRDKVRFADTNFQSYYFLSQGFSPSHYSVTVGKNGVITWETMQTNQRGEIVSWRGDWQGGKMEGVASYRPADQSARDFSFIGVGAAR